MEENRQGRQPVMLTHVEAVALSRVPPPKGAKVCGVCANYSELGDGQAICCAKSRKFRILYLKDGERTAACDDLFEENILLDLARLGLEYESDPEPERKD